MFLWQGSLWQEQFLHPGKPGDHCSAANQSGLEKLGTDPSVPPTMQTTLTHSGSKRGGVGVDCGAMSPCTGLVKISCSQQGLMISGPEPC